MSQRDETDYQADDYWRDEEPECDWFVPAVSYPRAVIDIAIIVSNGRLAVECDGAAYHSGEAARRDGKRDAHLRREGWTIMRFTGRDLHRDARACAVRCRPLVRRETAGTHEGAVALKGD